MTLGQGHKDLEAMGQLYHVEACFEALCKPVLMAASDFSCNFFRILTSGFEQCDDLTSVAFSLPIQTHKCEQCVVSLNVESAVVSMGYHHLVKAFILSDRWDRVVGYKKLKLEVFAVQNKDDVGV